MEEKKEPKQDETIFTAFDFSLQKYEKHVKNARTALYVTSALIVLGGLLSTYMSPSYMILDIWIEVVVMAGAFFVLAMWSNTKPFTALLVGFILYVVYQLLIMIVEPSMIGRGLIVKIIIAVYLVRGMNNAREAQQWKNVVKKD
jgi:hypothetical protein